MCSVQARLLQLPGPGAQAQRLWRTGIAAPWHVESSQSRDRTRVPCPGRWLHLGASREARSSVRDRPHVALLPWHSVPGQFTSSVGPILCGLYLHTGTLPHPRASSMVSSLLVARLEKPRNRVQPWDFILYLEGFGSRFT